MRRFTESTVPLHLNIDYITILLLVFLSPQYIKENSISVAVLWTRIPDTYTLAILLLRTQLCSHNLIFGQHTCTFRLAVFTIYMIVDDFSL